MLVAHLVLDLELDLGQTTYIKAENKKERKPRILWSQLVRSKETEQIGEEKSLFMERETQSESETGRLPLTYQFYCVAPLFFEVAGQVFCSLKTNDVSQNNKI